jgi:hypothetical protein
MSCATSNSKGGGRDNDRKLLKQNFWCGFSDLAGFWYVMQLTGGYVKRKKNTAAPLRALYNWPAFAAFLRSPATVSFGPLFKVAFLFTWSGWESTNFVTNFPQPLKIPHRFRR